MRPADAHELQLELYRQMTGEERLAIALNLHELACDISREGIRHQRPDATPEEIEKYLQERLRLAIS